MVGRRQPDLGIHHVPHLGVDRMLRKSRGVRRQIRIQFPHHASDARPLGIGNHRVPVLLRDVAGDLLAHVLVGEGAVGLSHRVLADHREQADLPQLDVAAGKREVGVSGIHVLDRCGAIELAGPGACRPELELLGVPRIELVAELVLVLVEPQPLEFRLKDGVLAVLVPVLQPFVEFRGFRQKCEVGVGGLAGGEPEGQVVAFFGEHRVGAEQPLGLVVEVYGAEELAVLGGEDVPGASAGDIDRLVCLKCVDLPGHVGAAVEPFVEERCGGAGGRIPGRVLSEVIERVENPFGRRVRKRRERSRTATKPKPQQASETLIHCCFYGLVTAEVVRYLPHCLLPLVLWGGFDHVLQRGSEPGHPVADKRPHVERRFGQRYPGVLEALERRSAGECVVRGPKHRWEIWPHLRHCGLRCVLQHVRRLRRFSRGRHGPKSPLE